MVPREITYTAQARLVRKTAWYVDVESGHLIIFDRNESRSWEDKLFHRHGRAGGVEIEVWGM